jgi:hypothetical protein
VWYGQDVTPSGSGPGLGFCNHGDQLSGSIKGGYFLIVGDYQLPKNDSPLMSSQ